ncbi:TRAP transporter substrate-binding protein [Propionivibrio dicarboxylicus]|uniref:Tripartite ATP-independent transporter solute receptor, DctP family n=1 Tax=Propionivibrio dicarboxylicus TaxID=83767 RepID=A0A1G8H0T5_9RHOO|nr:TRAP transporter substrate-binding protein [Propionivibrio dicarboxylicus]SDI00100.1 tripartite ATP-independent transporter solute receptor, DctP family [Propionivibrio dicarboxylicus]
MSRFCYFLLSLCGIALFFSQPAASQTPGSVRPISLRAALNNPKISGQYQGILIFKKLVEERTGGRIAVEIIADGILGDEEQLAEGMQQGTVDFTIHSSAKYANSVPEMDIYSPPYTFKNWDHMKAVMNSPVNDKLVQIVMERRGDHFVGVYTEGLRNVFTRKEIHKLDDLKGLRLRTMTGPSELGAWRALGANPTPTGYLELYSALQSGSVDGAENTMTALIGMRFHEAAKYVLRTAHNYMAMPAILSGKFVKKLPKELGDIVIQAAKDSAREQLDWAIEFDRNNEKILKEQYGVKITELSKADYEKALSICMSQHIDNAKRIGMESEQKLIADLRKKY